MTTIPFNLFMNCTNLRRIIIPESVAEIKDNAFYNVPDSCKFYVVTDSYAYNWALEHGYPVAGVSSITYVLNGGTNNPDNISAYENGDTFRFLEPNRSGYKFDAWYEDSACTTKITTTSGKTGNLTIYAKWIPYTYSIKFEANYPTDATPSSTAVAVADITGITSDQAVSIPSCTYACEKYEFISWNTKADGSGTAYKAGSNATALSEEDGATVPLYAQWILTPVNKISLSDARVNMNAGDQAEITATIEPADAANKNLIWESLDPSIATVTADAANNAKAIINALADGTVQIRATAADGGGCSAACTVIVGKALPRYTIRFMKNDAELYKETVFEGSTVQKIPSVEEANSTFVGWYADGVRWDGSSPVTSDIVLVARLVNNSTIKDQDESFVVNTALDTQPDLETEALTLVKGQKFTLSGNWTSGNAKILSISKKGAGAAKNVTASPVELTNLETGKKYGVTIIAPAIQKTAKLLAGTSQKLALSNYGDLPVTWTSSSPDIASISPDGVVSGVSKGSATISAYVNGVAFNCKVTVADADTGTRDLGKTVELVPMQSMTVKASGFKPKNATWSSDLPEVTSGMSSVAYENEVVRITNSGKITAIGSGETILKATSGAITLTLTVQVSEPVTQIVHMNVNGSKTIKIYGTKGNLPWVASDASVLQISGNKIKGLKAGTTVLTAVYENFEYNVMVYVEDPSITTEGVIGKYPKYTLNMQKGKTVILSTKQTYQNIIFKSKKNDIAFVDEAGILTARNKGKTVITAKVNGKAISLTVNVTE